jgi:hypothetical protein
VACLVLASGLIRPVPVFSDRLGTFVLLIGRPGPAIDGCELGLGVRGAHIDDANGFQPGTGRLDPEQPGLIAAHHTAPELFLGGEQ